MSNKSIKGVSYSVIPGDSILDSNIALIIGAHSHLDSGSIDEIRSATNGDFALGSYIFKEQVPTAPGRGVEPGRSGRPLTQD